MESREDDSSLFRQKRHAVLLFAREIERQREKKRETVRETSVKRDRVSLLAGGNGACTASTVSKL